MLAVRVAMAVALATVGLVTVGGARPASACSCTGQDLSVAALRADEVFTGVILQARPVLLGIAANGPVVEQFENRVRVENVKKGRVSEVTTVFSKSGSDSGCGVTLAMGEPIGFVLGVGPDGARRVNLCGGTAGAKEVEGLSFEPPPPDGTGPPFAVVSGYFGAATLAVIDRDLRPLGFGGEGEVAGALALCADREHLATLTGAEGGKVLRVERRRIADLAVVSSWQLARPSESPQWWRFRLSCDVAATMWVVGPPTNALGHEVYEVSDRGRRPIDVPLGAVVGIDEATGGAVSVEPPAPDGSVLVRRLGAVPEDPGRRLELPTHGPVFGVAVSRAGDLALVLGDRLVVVGGDGAVARDVALPQTGVVRDLAWALDGTLGFTRNERPMRLRPGSTEVEVAPAAGPSWRVAWSGDRYFAGDEWPPGWRSLEVATIADGKAGSLLLGRYVTASILLLPDGVAFDVGKVAPVALPVAERVPLAEADRERAGAANPPSWVPIAVLLGSGPAVVVVLGFLLVGRRRRRAR